MEPGADEYVFWIPVWVSVRLKSDLSSLGLELKSSQKLLLRLVSA